MGAIDFYKADGNISDVVSSDIFNVLIDMIDKYNINLAKNFGKKRVNSDSSAGFTELFWYCLDKSKFIRNLKVQVGVELLEILNPLTLKLEDHDEIDILVYANIAEFICNEIYDAIYLESDSEGYSYYYFEEDDDRNKRLEFIAEVNQILERNNLAYKLSRKGQFERIVSEDFQSILDAETTVIEEDVDNLIVDAKKKIKSSDRSTRLDGIEKIWDAFERVKTVYSDDITDKKTSANKLILNTIKNQPVLFNLVSQTLMVEFLTKAGNELRIRHHEIDKEIIKTDSQIDFLFQIMLSTLNYLINNQEVTNETSI
ncbi:hypothetical protein [Streptococcus equi]|uniref:Uncharacterized protein n=1 Tax=Streptococcus equi subsp. ruminatorum TaxID=254358 RepID=A0A6M1KW18_9STRE|nr:hypothetical protein [Streptococcus equi]NGL83231.1 hypothetical protein [Streptococcus equi subsp. ruminatorum]